MRRQVRFAWMAGATALATLHCPPPATAKYTPPRFGQMAREAEVIAVGRIADLRDDDYDLEVERWVAGDRRASRLTVRRFVDWTCASRNPPYARGQRVLAFLHSPEADALSALGGGCEGEVLLEDGRAAVSFPPFGIRSPPEAQVIEAAEVFRSGFRSRDAEDFTEAWHRLLLHANPFLAAVATEEVLDWRSVLRRRAVLEDRAGDPLPPPAAVLVDALLVQFLRGSPDLRAKVASNLEDAVGKEVSRALVPRLEHLLRSGDPPARPGAALALAFAEPGESQRRSALLRVLSADDLPLDARLACTRYAEFLHDDDEWPPPDAVPAGVRDAAVHALLSEEDPRLQRGLVRTLTAWYGGDRLPWDGDFRPFRDRWLVRLGASDGEDAGSLPGIPPYEDPYMSDEDRAVALPPGVADHEGPTVAWVVRALRRAKKADLAGDRDTARAECRLALLPLFGSVEETARSLGADLEWARARVR